MSAAVLSQLSTHNDCRWIEWMEHDEKAGCSKSHEPNLSDVWQFMIQCITAQAQPYCAKMDFEKHKNRNTKMRVKSQKQQAHRDPYSSFPCKEMSQHNSIDWSGPVQDAGRRSTGNRRTQNSNTRDARNESQAASNNRSGSASNSARQSSTSNGSNSANRNEDDDDDDENQRRPRRPDNTHQYEDVRPTQSRRMSSAEHNTELNQQGNEHANSDQQDDRPSHEETPARAEFVTRMQELDSGPTEIRYEWRFVENDNDVPFSTAEFARRIRASDLPPADDDWLDVDDEDDEDYHFQDSEEEYIAGLVDEAMDHYYDYDSDESDEDMEDDEGKYLNNYAETPSLEYLNDPFDLHYPMEEGSIEAATRPTPWTYSSGMRGHKYMPSEHVVRLNHVPSKVMQSQLHLGTFAGGSVLPPTSVHSYDASRYPRSTIDHLINRKFGGSSTRYFDRRDITSRFLPENPGHVVDYFPEAPAYGGKFSADGRLFYLYAQDFRIRFYDVTDPDRPVRKLVLSCDDGDDRQRWTITDASLSSDNRILASSSLTTHVRISVLEEKDNELREQSAKSINFLPDYNESRGSGRSIFSVELSPDNQSVLAGGAKSIGGVCITNIETGKTMRFVKGGFYGHTEDVNAAKYMNPNVVVSGSDDGTVRLWDLRTKGNGIGSDRVFVGHTEGITSVDSNEAGTSIISNSKDQTLKLWDIRMGSKEEDVPKIKKSMTGYHYQTMSYSGPKNGIELDDIDASVMTYRGHSVLETMMRCAFSPMATTGQKYIYSGSSSGQVLVWKLSGEIIRVYGATEAALRAGPVNACFPGSTSRYRPMSGTSPCRDRVIRQAAWHPFSPHIYAPVLCANVGRLTIFSHNLPISQHPNAKHLEFDYRYSQPSADLNRRNQFFSK